MRHPKRGSTRLKPLKDCVRPPLRVLFVGINPGIRSAEIGHHFAGYSNRFWKLLFDSGLVPERIHTEDDRRLPEWNYGITNLVSRPTAGIDTLRSGEYAAGITRLRRKIHRWRPEVVALVGVTLVRALFRRGTTDVALGLQPELFGGARVFALPNPSGRNANYSYDEMLDAFKTLREHLERRAADAPARPAFDPRPRG
jgi:double-stranded uracil-DNA glycosylase